MPPTASNFCGEKIIIAKLINPHSSSTPFAKLFLVLLLLRLAELALHDTSYYVHKRFLEESADKALRK